MSHHYVTVSIVLVFAISLASSIPIDVVKTKPGLKVKSQNDLVKLELLSPIDNLVEPEFVNLDQPQQPLQDSLVPPPPPPPQPFQPQEESTETEDVLFPDRPGFFTGHRIPPSVLDRISGTKYVDSSNFRNRETSTTTSKSTTTQLPEEPSGELNPPKEDSVVESVPEVGQVRPLSPLHGGLTSEADHTYLSTLDKFVPDYF